MCSSLFKYGLISATLLIFFAYTDAKEQTVKFSNQTDFLIDTDGCFIPNHMKPLGYPYLQKTPLLKCKPRIVHIDRTNGDKYRFRIDDEAKRKLELRYVKDFNQQFHCGYRVLSLATLAMLSKVRVLTSGDILEIDEDSIIIVTCTYLPEDLKNLNNSAEFKLYKDSYVLFKKSDLARDLQHSARWNVLLLGMESMSRARAYNTMPVVVQYLTKQGWLDFRGHHLVSHTLLPNLLAILSGSVSTKAPAPKPGSLFLHPDEILWKQFSLFEYVTAMGHDITNKSPLLQNLVKLYQQHRTDHLFRVLPEFMKYSPHCFGRLLVSEHLLSYAEHFVEAYMKNDNFFGFFFTGHRYDSDPLTPHTFQAPLIEFLEKIRRPGALKNTFVFLFGAATSSLQKIKEEEVGITFNDRLPMLFVWVPLEFRKMNPNQYRNIKDNQFRFTTHFDLYATLRGILQMSEPVDPALGVDCKSCISLFKRVPLSRSCEVTHTDKTLCACQNRTNISEEMVILAKLMEKAQEIQHSGKMVLTAYNETRSYQFSNLDYYK